MLHSRDGVLQIKILGLFRTRSLYLSHIPYSAVIFFSRISQLVRKPGSDMIRTLEPPLPCFFLYTERWSMWPISLSDQRTLLLRTWILYGVEAFLAYVTVLQAMVMVDVFIFRASDSFISSSVVVLGFYLNLMGRCLFVPGS